MESYKTWQQARQNLSRAREWIKLLGDKDSQDGRPFSLSAPHGNVKMVICGQHCAGGQNYWDSPEAFNRVLAEVMVENFQFISGKVIEKMQKTERTALIACKDMVDTMNEEIEVAEKSTLGAE
jgi:hypothetical protein